MDESPYNDNYGVPRMQLALLQKGIKAGIRRITRIMREHGWLHKPHRRPKGFTHATTEIQKQENLIKQDFSASQPLKKLWQILLHLITSRWYRSKNLICIGTTISRYFM
ncbi:MAG: IS3 family transposase [Enterococcus sp.]